MSNDTGANATQLRPGTTGHKIDTELLAEGTPRQGEGLGTTTVDLHIPRSKIAVGGFGQDSGDASHETPLPVESRSARHAHELQLIATLNNHDAALRGRGTERFNLVDRRGDTGERGGRR